MEISITRALNEIKLLEKRIYSKIQDSSFITANKKSNKKIQGAYSLEEFTDRAKADYDSTNDLIERRKIIKSLIATSNATNKIEINSQEYSVAEAIERKNSIEFEETLLSHMKQQYGLALSQVTSKNEQMEANLDKQLEIMLGSENKKTDGAKAYSDSYREQNSFELVDGLKLKDKIDKLQIDIDEFKNNVDFALSEHNAICKITIVD